MKLQKPIDPLPWKTCALAELKFAAVCALKTFYKTTAQPGDEIPTLAQCNATRGKFDPDHWPLLAVVRIYHQLEKCDVSEIVTFGNHPGGVARDAFNIASHVHHLIFKQNTAIQQWLKQNRT